MCIWWGGVGTWCVKCEWTTEVSLITLFVINESTFERVETISYFDRRFRKETNPYNFAFLPDETQFYCPLTGDPYIIEINDEGNSVRVSSPIRSYRDNRYGFFALKTRSHGYIIDGTRSWDN